ncbi:hypothetical protein AGMMS49941_12510 [Deferribacterales bacterium]|nr:hypothetical protein AGMMS49941_12510 [Deferribacterales bacterium]
MNFGMLQQMFLLDVAIDLGTANTLVYVSGKGIVCNEPSVVAIDSNTDEIIAIGAEAKGMIGRTPRNITTIRPMKDGVIADFDTAERMLRYFIDKVQPRRMLIRPRMIICVPSGVTQVERRAVREIAINSGARNVHIIEEPMAAALGAGLPVNKPSGNMVVDIGGGTTEVALISLFSIVYSSSVRVGGDEMTDSIVNYVKEKYGLLISTPTGEYVKELIGSAYPLDEVAHAEIKGRELVTGSPKIREVSDMEIREALEESVLKIIGAVIFRITASFTFPSLCYPTDLNRGNLNPLRL